MEVLDSDVDTKYSMRILLNCKKSANRNNATTLLCKLMILFFSNHSSALPLSISFRPYNTLNLTPYSYAVLIEAKTDCMIW